MLSNGYWVGIKLDDPTGDSDCTGFGFFECQPGFGSFLRPNDIEVGDQFVKEDDFDMEEDMI
jgi:tubulin-folding cofactor B